MNREDRNLKKIRIPSSRRSMHGYILTYPGLKDTQPFWSSGFSAEVDANSRVWRFFFFFCRKSSRDSTVGVGSLDTSVVKLPRVWMDGARPYDLPPRDTRRWSYVSEPVRYVDEYVSCLSGFRWLDCGQTTVNRSEVSF